MASLTVIGEFDIEYSLVDGRIRSFNFRDRYLYDEDKKISTEGWREKLIEIVKDYHLDVDDGKGLHAFLAPLLGEVNVRT